MASTPAVAAGTASLSLTIAPATTPIQAGANAQWTVNYQCSSVDPSITTCDNAVIKVDVTKLSPMGNPITCTVGGSTGTSDFAPTATGFIGTGPGNSIPVGASGQMTFACKTAVSTTPDQSTLVATATFTSDSAVAPATDTATPIVITAQTGLTIDKVLLGDSVLDGVTAYRITADAVKAIPGAGTWNTKNPVLVDTLPAGAVFVSASNGGVYDPATNTITWTTPTADVASPSFPDYTVTVHVRYPSTTFGPSDTVTNGAQLTATTLTDPMQVTATDSVSHTFKPATAGKGMFSKDVTPNKTVGTAVFKSDTFRWNLKLQNTGGVPIGGTIYDYPPCQSAPLVDALPQDCHDPGFTISAFELVPQGSVFTFYLADGTTRTVTKSTDASVTYAVPAGWLVAGFAIALPDDSVDPSTTLTINAVGKLTAGNDYVPMTQTNCAQWSIANAPATLLTATGNTDKTCQVAYFKNAAAKLQIRKSYDGGSDALLAGQVAPWSLLVTNEGAASDPHYIAAELHVTDTLPSGVTYVPGSAMVTTAAGAFTYDTDFTTADLTVTQSGQNLTFSFPAGTELDKQRGFTISFKTTVNPGLGVSTQTNTASVWDDDDPTWVPSNGQGTTSSATFSTGSASQAGAQKTVEGDFDDSYLYSVQGSPAVGTSPAGGTAKWRLNIGSLGSTPIDDLVIYDVFPYVGDTGVSGGQSGMQRHSQFQPTLAGPFTLPSGVVATYSLSTNPCRPEVYPSQPAGCDSTWLATADVTDWSAVRAVRIDATGKTYQAGQLEQVGYTMNLPEDATPGDVAWNSLAYTAVGPNGALLPSEPVKVGIRVAQPPSIDIEKTDADGNDADTADEAATLDPEAPTTLRFTVTNDGGEPLEDLKVGDQVTVGSATVTGLTCDFPDGSTGTEWAGPLLVGAGFECTATLGALGYDNVHADDATVGATGSLSGTPVTDHDEYHATTPSPPPIDLALSKKLVTTGTLIAGQTVQFTLTPHNNGPGTAIKGWSVSDQLPDGLTFTSASGAGYDCAGTPVAPADVTCVADAPLAADADGAPALVTATIDAGVTGSLRNESWVAPGDGDVDESNPLVVPAPGTDTAATDTNNDAHADVHVSPVVDPPSATHPGLSIVKSTSTTVVLEVGQKVPYEFLVTNTGDVALTRVRVKDTLVAPSKPANLGPISCGPGAIANGAVTLQPGESITCFAVYRVARADLAAAWVSDLALATGTPPTGPPVKSPLSPVDVPVKTPVAPPGDHLNHVGTLPDTGAPVLKPWLWVGFALVALGVAVVMREARQVTPERKHRRRR